MNKKYDLIVIGWGKAGKTIAAKMGANGKKVALIEKDSKMYGGTCVNVGCLPTKSLVHSAKLLNQIENYELQRDYNFNNLFFKNSMEKKIELVKKLNKKNFSILNDNSNVDLYLGKASFLSNNEVEVETESEKLVLEADKILINTGSVARKLNISGENNINIMSSEEVLELKELPKKLLIVGAGYIGLEFATYFSNFGSEVTIFQNDDNFLPREDKEDSNFILEVLKKKGINVLFNTKINSFSDDNGLVKVEYEIDSKKENKVFDKVLVAVGRVANIDGLNLEKAGINVNSRNEIVVDEKLRTSAKNIWAAGDVKGGALFTYISLDDSRIILPQLLGVESERTINNRYIVPTSTFIDPPFARVGLNEKEAKAKNIAYTKKYSLTMSIPKAHVINETEGFSKILINENDEIIGATLFHYEAHEMINLLALAIQEKIKYQVLRDFIYTHPVFTESLNDILA